MKKKKYLFLIIVFAICGCQSNNKFIGTWKYEHVSPINGGITETIFYFDSGDECHYVMGYTLNNKKIIDEESKCTWKLDGDYIVYTTYGKESYLYYDKDDDKLYTLDSTTKTKKWEFNRY